MLVGITTGNYLLYLATGRLRCYFATDFHRENLDRQ